MKRPSRRSLILLATLAAAILLAFGHVPVLSAVARFLLCAGVVALGLWGLWHLYHAFLWKVGRRLAFSYFLLGVLPIPLLLVVLAMLGYLLSGFFQGHLYRDAVQSVQRELDSAAHGHLEAFLAGAPPRGAAGGDTAFGYYRKGKKLSGDPRLPAVWPAWLEAPAARTPPGDPRAPRFVAVSGGRPTLAAAASRGGGGVVTLYTGDLDGELSRRAEVWIELFRSDDPGLDTISLQVGGRKVPIQHARKDQQAADAARFFKGLSRGERFWDSPILWWGEISGSLADLATGRPVADYVAANLNATPNVARHHLFSAAAEIDGLAWGILLLVSFLLFDVYAAAALMAVFMIVGLSRAVNRLSRGTEAVRRGDFGVRIPVRRRDQVGDLQRSFNEMAGNLESLVATAAQKESLEKELELARNLQKSLLPGDLSAIRGVELSTLFEPSAAIGGDYFDVLRLSDEELAVIIADVSGHGLSSGLRMAMLKAALLILVEETREPEEILSRLDAVVRANRERRFFVTATLGLFNLRTGVLRITNAGHPPTYRVHGAEVEEVLLPSSPLGGLGHHYVKATLKLAPGDSVVWLSDGLIEATNAADEPFGYDQVKRVLAGTQGESAVTVRDRLLAAVDAHAAGQPLADDRTLMVMRWAALTAAAPTGLNDQQATVQAPPVAHPPLHS